MALNYVTLTVDVYDAQGNVPTSGYATFTPSATLTDTTNNQIVAQIPIVVSFKPSGPPTVKLLATDNGTVNPGGWGWGVSFTGTGLPSAFNFFLAYGDGASQNLADLAPVSSVVTMAAYMPLAGGTFTGDVNAATVALTDGASISLDASEGNVFTVTLGGDRTLADPTNPSDEQLIRVVVTQDGTGSRTLAYGAAYNFGAGSPPVLSTDAGARDTLGFAYNAGAAVWDFLASTTSGGGAALDTTAADIQPIGIQTAGAIGLAADSGHIHPYQPWQFLPETYGAVGNGKVVTDLVLASNTTATSATAAFTSGDTGKHIMINGGAGTTSAPLITTITYVNSTTVTLGNAASVTGTGYQAVYGTDDTSAINSAIAAAKTYALASQYFAEVLFAAKIYVLSSGPTQASSPQTNAQIVIPWPAVAGTSQKLVISLKGAGAAGHAQYWESTTPNLAGTCLVSMTTAPGSPSGSFGNQSVIGGPSAGGAFTGAYANTKVSVENLSVWCGAYTNQIAFDFAYLSAMYMRECAAHIFAPPGVGGGKSPLLKDLPADTNFQAAIGVGLRSPVTGNNADAVADSCCFEGYSRPMYLYDHLTATRLFSIYSDGLLEIDTSLGVSGVEHLISISNLGCEAFNGGIKTVGSSGPFVALAINMDAEVASPSYDISDTGNILHGWVSWDDTTRTDPTISGAANLKITNASRGPGVWSGAPSVPATTVAATNTAYRDATVYLASGGAAVTVIKVNSTTTGLTLGTSGTVTVRVPAGATITLTYASTAPTWVWVLD